MAETVIAVTTATDHGDAVVVVVGAAVADAVVAVAAVVAIENAAAVVVAADATATNQNVNPGQSTTQATKSGCLGFFFVRAIQRSLVAVSLGGACEIRKSTAKSIAALSLIRKLCKVGTL